jgi:uncharacterized protein (DUF2345 family)
VAEAPSSILMSSPASTAVFAGEQLHIVTQGDAQYGAAHTLSSVSGKSSTLFTHAGGLEAVAANGPLSIQAHTDQLELLADKEVTVVSVNDSISINAKTKIVLKAGQTSITLDGANITFACPGTFSVKGSGHSMDGGASSAAALAKLPDSRVKLFDEQVRAINQLTGKPITDLPYKITTASGDVHYGITDVEGKTARVATIAAEKIEVEWGATDPQIVKPKPAPAGGAGAASKPPAKAETPPGASVDKIIDTCPAFRSSMDKFEKSGGAVEYGAPGGGSFLDVGPPKKIVIDPNDKGQPSLVAQTLAHELGHSEYTMPTVSQPTKGTTKAEYVNKWTMEHLKDEAHAVAKNIEMKRCVMKGKGGNIGVAGAKSAEYEKIFDKYPKAEDRQKAIDEIARTFGTENPSTAPTKTYTEYYGQAYKDWWDTNVKRDPY